MSIDWNTYYKHILSWNGSNLGSYQFETFVQSWQPSTTTTATTKPVTLRSIVKFNDDTNNKILYIPVYLKPNFSNRLDQVIIDEFKPLFDLNKMGSHILSLNKVVSKIDKNLPWLYHDDQNHTIINGEPQDRNSSYFMFRARVNSNNNIEIDPMIRDVPENQWDMNELRKIIIFREITNVTDTNLLNIISTSEGLLSIDEARIKRPGSNPRKLSRRLEQLLFGNVSRKNVLNSMINDSNINNNNTNQNKLSELYNDMNNIVDRIDPSFNWVPTMVINNINQILQ